MHLIELNPSGNFDPWDLHKIEELQKVQSPKALKKLVLYENSTMRLWNVCLEPKERLPFYKRKQFYSWTCLTDGIVILRNGNGQIDMIKFDKGETKYWDLGEQGTVSDLENIGENAIVLHIIEYMSEVNYEFSSMFIPH